MSGIADGGIANSIGDDRPRGKRAPDARGDGVQHDAGSAAEALRRDRRSWGEARRPLRHAGSGRPRDGLPATALRRVRGARNDAIAHLLRDVAVEQAPALRLPAGLPDGDEAVAMASALFARLA
jgi:hypothetical protein